MNLKDHKSGYDLEELYFEKLNQELIKKNKEASGTSGATTQAKCAEIIALRPLIQPKKKAA